MTSAVGIDPGQSGAVAYISGTGEMRVWKGLKTLRDIAKAVQHAQEKTPARTAIEFVHSRPGEGVCSVFSFGRSTGTAFGAFFVSSDMPIYEVPPQTWQNHFRAKLGDIPSGAGTFDSRKIAPRVFTEAMLEHCRFKGGPKTDGKFGLDHNACDAALIALWVANLPEEALAGRISEHFLPPEKTARKPRK